jgi:hypothetical protein
MKEQSFQDANDIIALTKRPEWDRYYLRRLKEKRDRAVRDALVCERPSGMSLAEFDRLLAMARARVALLDDILSMPDRDLNVARKDTKVGV